LGDLVALADLRGDAHRHAAGRKFEARWDQGAGGDLRSGADDRSVEDERTRADQRAVTDRGALDVRVVPDDAPRADDGGLDRGAVDDRAVLDVGLLPHGDRAVVPAQHRRGPHGGTGTEGDVADHDRVGVNPRVGMDIGDTLAECVDSHDCRTYLERTPPGVSGLETSARREALPAPGSVVALPVDR